MLDINNEYASSYAPPVDLSAGCYLGEHRDGKEKKVKNTREKGGKWRIM
jgi:hypothetical protein